MLRRNARWGMIKRHQSKDISPLQTDGKMEHSFERLVQQIDAAQIMKAKKQHYDKAATTHVAEKHEEINENIQAGKFVPEAMSEISSKPTFEKVFDPDLLRKTTAPEDYRVPRESIAEQDARVFRFRLAAAFATFALLNAFYFGQRYLEYRSKLDDERRRKEAEEIERSAAAAIKNLEIGAAPVTIDADEPSTSLARAALARFIGPATPQVSEILSRPIPAQAVGTAAWPSVVGEAVPFHTPKWDPATALPAAPSPVVARRQWREADGSVKPWAVRRAELFKQREDKLAAAASEKERIARMIGESADASVPSPATPLSSA